MGGLKIEAVEDKVCGSESCKAERILVQEGKQTS